MEIGERHGRFIVVDRNGSYPSGHPRWLVRCSCGHVCAMGTSSITRMSSRPCGHAGGPIKDLIGQRFGRRTVTGRGGTNRHGQYLWQWICDCGNAGESTNSSVRSNQSCGCLVSEKLVARSTRHGLKSRRAPAPEYAVWVAMKGRCNNPSDAGFKNYGGRGIGYADDWESFAIFVSDMGRRPTKTHTLERRDNNGDYGPGNCYWASREVQANNKRSTSYVNYEGERLALTPLCRRFGINPSVVRWRLKNGWSVNDALRQPVSRGGRPFLTKS